MKLFLEYIDREQFMVHQHLLNGEVVWLVQPQYIACKWTQANKHLRSSVWNNDGELISAGFPKFVNWSENPDCFPVPTSLKGTTIVEKIDGSLLILSKYKGQYILRTRGTVDATKLDNGAELDIFKQTILPKLPFQEKETWDASILFEWTSPANRIVIHYGQQPDWYLVGVVNHDYSLWTQGALDAFAQDKGFKRPPSYTFPSVEELMKDIEGWKGKEGVVVYSNDGQNMWKVKAAEYLIKHRMKEEFSSIDKVVDFFIQEGCPDWQSFTDKIAAVVDYETVTEMQGDISRIIDAWKQVQQIKEGMQKFVNDKLKPLPTRRDQAALVISSYGGENNNRTNMVFSLLDGKLLTGDQNKRLLYQCLKK